MRPIHLSWVLSGMSAGMLWLMGSRSIWGPRLGLLNQALWLVYIVWIEQWGLLPGALFFTFVHARNLARWGKAREDTAV